MQEQEIRHQSSVEAFLLQRHRTLLFRITSLRISSRAMLLLIMGTIVLVNQMLSFRFYAILVVTFVLLSLWFGEHILLNRTIRRLEEILAGRSGGIWEDVYIKSRYRPYGLFPSQIQNLEPILWLIIILILFYLRRFYSL